MMGSTRRFTKQRRLVLEEIRQSHDHPTAEELHKRIVKHYPSISLGTVYRNLNVLCDMHEVKKIAGSYSCDRFDVAYPQHYHFQCEVCDGLFDMKIPYQSIFNDTAAAETGLRIKSHNTLFEGICKVCQQAEDLTIKEKETCINSKIINLETC